MKGDSNVPCSHRPGGYLVRKAVVPDSWGKEIAAQQRHIQNFPGERLALPAEFAYAAVLRFLETGEHICGACWSRFPVQAADGDWVSADWNGDRLYVSYGHGLANSVVGSCSVRTS